MHKESRKIEKGIFNWGEKKKRLDLLDLTKRGNGKKDSIGFLYIPYQNKHRQ